VPPDLKFLHRLPRARPGYFESKSGNIRTPIMHRAAEANGFVFVGGTIADDTSVSMGEQTRMAQLGITLNDADLIALV
jgi:hypothetical protein